MFMQVPVVKGKKERGKHTTSLGRAQPGTCGQEGTCTRAKNVSRSLSQNNPVDND